MSESDDDSTPRPARTPKQRGNEPARVAVADDREGEEHDDGAGDDPGPSKRSNAGRGTHTRHDGSGEDGRDGDKEDDGD
jgi:hypothetical protein